MFTLDVYAKRLPRYWKNERSFDIEIARLNVILGFVLDAEAADLYFNCDSVLLDEENLLFDWSNVSNFIVNAVFTNSRFCKGNWQKGTIDHDFA